MKRLTLMMGTLLASTLFSQGMMNRKMGTGKGQMFMQNNKGMMQRQKEKRQKKMWNNLAKLNLTEDQKKQIEELKNSNKTTISDLHKQIKINRKKFRKTMQEKKSIENTKELKRLHNRMEDLKRKKSNFMFQRMLKVRSILTNEQIAEMHKKMMNKRRGRRNSRRQRNMNM